MATQNTRLIADIGGTNARFALVGSDGAPEAEGKLAVADYPGVVAAARAYLDGRQVDEAVFAVATPVQGDEVAFTNSEWRFSIAAARAQLGVERFAVINDFVAQALAIPRLDAQDVCTLKPGHSVAGCPIGVIGPGTGLGVAGLLPDGDQFRPLASEGGHVSFSPTNHRQLDILRALFDTFEHVSNERVLSGPGLVNLARAIAQVDGRAIDIAEPNEVSARARSNCPICIEALQVFARVLGSAAADLALTLLASGGVYVMGGLCRRLETMLEVEEFQAGFLCKGRFRRWLEPVPVHQVLREHTGLIGAAAYQLSSH